MGGYQVQGPGAGKEEPQLLNSQEEEEEDAESSEESELTIQELPGASEGEK